MMLCTCDYRCSPVWISLLTGRCLKGIFETIFRLVDASHGLKTECPKNHLLHISVIKVLEPLMERPAIVETLPLPAQSKTFEYLLYILSGFKRMSFPATNGESLLASPAYPPDSLIIRLINPCAKVLGCLIAFADDAVKAKWHERLVLLVFAFISRNNSDAIATSLLTSCARTAIYELKCYNYEGFLRVIGKVLGQQEILAELLSRDSSATVFEEVSVLLNYVLPDAECMGLSSNLLASLSWQLIVERLDGKVFTGKRAALFEGAISRYLGGITSTSLDWPQFYDLSRDETFALQLAALAGSIILCQMKLKEPEDERGGESKRQRMLTTLPAILLDGQHRAGAYLALSSVLIRKREPWMTRAMTESIEELIATRRTAVSAAHLIFLESLLLRLENSAFDFEGCFQLLESCLSSKDLGPMACKCLGTLIKHPAVPFAFVRSRWEILCDIAKSPGHVEFGYVVACFYVKRVKTVGYSPLRAEQFDFLGTVDLGRLLRSPEEWRLLVNQVLMIILAEPLEFPFAHASTPSNFESLLEKYRPDEKHGPQALKSTASLELAHAVSRFKVLNTYATKNGRSELNALVGFIAGPLRRCIEVSVGEEEANGWLAFSEPVIDAVWGSPETLSLIGKLLFHSTNDLLCSYGVAPTRNSPPFPLPSDAKLVFVAIDKVCQELLTREEDRLLSKNWPILRKGIFAVEVLERWCLQDNQEPASRFEFLTFMTQICQTLNTAAPSPLSRLKPKTLAASYHLFSALTRRLGPNMVSEWLGLVENLLETSIKGSSILIPLVLQGLERLLEFGRGKLPEDAESLLHWILALCEKKKLKGRAKRALYSLLMAHPKAFDEGFLEGLLKEETSPRILSELCSDCRFADALPPASFRGSHEGIIRYLALLEASSACPTTKNFMPHHIACVASLASQYRTCQVINSCSVSST